MTLAKSGSDRPDSEAPLLGAIEAGGTKFVCAVGTGPEALEEERFPTTTPSATLARCIEFFRAHPPIAALGIGAFGPLDLRHASPGFGSITQTPKPGWSSTALIAPLAQALGVPVVLDTDVNAALLGEARWGAARGFDSALYVTVGTGIGGGALIGGRLVHGLVHPEMGHLLLPREPDDAEFTGACPFHGARCWEGLAAGPALERRWGQNAHELPSDHPAWDLEGRYLGAGLANLVLTLSPERIVIGGGIMQTPGLVERAQRGLVSALGGYVQAAALREGAASYLVLPELGQRAGILGALALALGVSGAG